MARAAKGFKEVYGLWISETVDPLNLEMEMIRRGGSFKNKTTGKIAGLGLEYHFKAAIKLIWPHVKFHKWLDMIVDNYVQYRTVVIIGPASCVAGHTKIPNPITGTEETIESLYLSGKSTVVQTLRGPIQTSVPVCKGVAALFEVLMENGTRFTATKDHRVLTPNGYVRVASLEVGDRLLSYVQNPLLSNEELSPLTHASSALSYFQTIPDFQFYYPSYFHSCGVPLPSSLIASQDSVPLLNGVHVHNLHDLSEDDLEEEQAYNHFCQSSNLSDTHRHVLQKRYKETYGSLHGSSETQPLCGGLCQSFERSQRDRILFDSSQKPYSYAASKRQYPFSSGKYMVQLTKVESIKYIGRDKFYDLHVPIANHYFAEGTIHHNSGKTLGAALCVLLDYYCYPSSTTVIICSTTKERLEDRIWGEIKKLHRDAVDRYAWIPGNLIEGRMRLVTDHRSKSSEGRDFRNGIVGVPCRKGGEYTGLGDFVGLKNKRVRLLGDELSLLPRVWVDSISNLDKNPDFKAVGLGNAKDTTDALGVLAEPATRLGGWESGLDQVPVSKTWEIRRPNGICIQLVGSESPNLDGKLGIPLITQEAIDRDVAFYGKDSLWYTMMCQGMMPRGQGSRRVLTRQQCVKNGATGEPQWLNSQRTKIAFLDAAYRGVGGDRCVFGTLEYGYEANIEVDTGTAFVTSMINHSAPTVNKRHILAITFITVVPIKDGPNTMPEDQIVAFCQKHCEDNAIPPENFFYDSGMRTSLVQTFGRIWSPRVNSIDCGGKPTDRRVSGDIDMACSAYYSKRITEIWYSVALTVQNGQFRGMSEDVMMEFCSREYGIVGNNKIEVESKQKMKEKTGRSPDLADSVAIGCEGARTRGFVIKSNRPSKMVKQDQTWKRELKQKAAKLREARTLRAA